VAIWDVIPQNREKAVIASLTLLQFLAEEEEMRHCFATELSTLKFLLCVNESTEQHVANVSQWMAILPGLTAKAIGRMVSMLVDRPPPESFHAGGQWVYPL
jgi:hypothetical protein